MKAVTISGGALVVADRPDPEPGVGELLVRVRGAGLNAADLLQMAGFYPAPPGSPADIPGMELAGEVVAVGEGVHSHGVGDRVMAVVGGGAQAELCLVHERTAIPVPDGVDWPAAGGFPEAFTTAHDALFTQARLVMGERLLVHGAAGGVGTAAVQLGVAAGALVTATVRNADLRGSVAELGAAVVAPDAFVDAGPFDVALELVGASNLADNLKALAVGGRISIIGVGGGGSRTEIDLLTLMQKRARLMGSTLRARPLEQKADAAVLVTKSVVPLLAGGRVRVPIEAALPLEQAVEAYERFRSGGKFGKIVLTN